MDSEIVTDRGCGGGDLFFSDTNPHRCAMTCHGCVTSNPFFAQADMRSPLKLGLATYGVQDCVEHRVAQPRLDGMGHPQSYLLLL